MNNRRFLAVVVVIVLAFAPTPDTALLPEHDHETIRHMLFGTLTGVQLTIQNLHKKHDAEPNDWNTPISTGRPNAVMAILVKRITIQKPSAANS